MSTSVRSQLAVQQTEPNGLARALATVDAGVMPRARWPESSPGWARSSLADWLPVFDAEAWWRVEMALLLVAMPQVTMDMGFELQWVQRWTSRWGPGVS
jgi:hypothetical protein